MITMQDVQSRGIQQRWIFAGMCFLGLLHAYAMRACLSITLTEMVLPIKSEVVFDDSCPFIAPVITNSTNEPVVYTKSRYDWSEYTQGLVLSSFYYGYVITHLPGGAIAGKYGGKHTLGFGVFLTAILTLLTPLSITYANSFGLMILRVIMGLAQGIIYPAINVMISQWTPPGERSRTGTFVFGGEGLGTIYANSIGGLILFYFEDWSIVFYLIGGTGVAWYLLWLVLCYNNPREHPFISSNELNYLNKQLSEHTHEKPAPIPWIHVLKSKALWAAIIAMLGFNWSLITMVTYLPKYMSSVLRFSVKDNGYLNSLVCICMWISSIAASWSTDYVVGKEYISRTRARKSGSVIALLCSASFIVAASYAECDKFLVSTMFAIGMGLLGAAYPSVVINTLDLSPNYSGTLMALSNGISAGITGIVSPYIISIVTTDQTLGEWRIVFWILFGISSFTTFVFLCFGSGEVQYWNDPEFNIPKNDVKTEECNKEKSNLEIIVTHAECTSKITKSDAQTS